MTPPTKIDKIAAATNAQDAAKAASQAAGIAAEAYKNAAEAAKNASTAYPYPAIKTCLTAMAAVFEDLKSKEDTTATRYERAAGEFDKVQTKKIGFMNREAKAQAAKAERAERAAKEAATVAWKTARGADQMRHAAAANDAIHYARWTTRAAEYAAAIAGVASSIPAESDETDASPLKEVTSDLARMTSQLIEICRSDKQKDWQKRGALIAAELRDVHLRLSALAQAADQPKG